MMRRNQAGFTLLEVLAALSVFLIGVVGVLSLLTSATRLHQQSQNTLQVADVLGEVELLIQREVAMAVVQEGTGLPAPVEPTPVPGHERFTYAWSMRGGQEGLPYVLELTLGWKEGGRVQTFETQRILGERLPLTAWVETMKRRPR